MTTIAVEILAPMLTPALPMLPPRKHEVYTYKENLHTFNFLTGSAAAVTFAEVPEAASPSLLSPLIYDDSEVTLPGAGDEELSALPLGAGVFCGNPGGGTHTHISETQIQAPVHLKHA